MSDRALWTEVDGCGSEINGWMTDMNPLPHGVWIEVFRRGLIKKKGGILVFRLDEVKAAIADVLQHSKPEDPDFDEAVLIEARRLKEWISSIPRPVESQMTRVTRMLQGMVNRAR